jgi:short-subunit dehydrogenase
LIADSVVFITGASEGIGAACARRLAGRGAKLALLALPGNGFGNTVSANTLQMAGDITDADFRQESVRAALDHFGRIDILVNNVGVGLYAPPSTADVELSKRVFDVNVIGPMGLTQLVIPHMRTRRSGVIVNIGSVGGRVSLPWASVYCASKFAVHAINDSLRRELSRDGIHVMKVCPGIVETRFREHVLAGVAPEPVAGIRRVVSAEDVADAMIRGIERRSRTVYVPALSRAFMGLEMLSSYVMDWYIRRQW